MWALTPALHSYNPLTMVHYARGEGPEHSPPLVSNFLSRSGWGRGLDEVDVKCFSTGWVA